MLAVHFIMIVKNHFSLLVSLVLFGLGCIYAQSSNGGALELDADDPDINTLETPDFGQVQGSNRRGKSKSWMEFDVPLEFETTNNEEHFVDEVTVDWYVAIKDPKSSSFLLLEKSVDYVNFPTKEEISVSVYLSPASIKILTGKDRVSKSDVRAVAAVVSVNGREMGLSSSMSEANWWDSPSLLKSSLVELMSKDETPFKFHWWDQYGEIKSR